MKVGFTGLLFLLFLGLKLGGVIAWSWVWVTAPLWIPIALAGLFIAFLGICVLFKVLQTFGGPNVKKA
jgi:hypothetical protein